MRNSISRWQIPSRRKWNVKLTCCSSFPWFAQFSIVLSSSFDRILYRLPYRTIRTTAWMLYSGVSGVAKVREFGHIINLCVYRHYDVGHTACIWGDQTHEYIQRGSRCVSVCVCVVFSHLHCPCRQHDRLRSSIFKCARRTEIIYSGSGACIESINLTFTYHTLNRAHVLHLHNKCCATKSE